ncbi:MAG: bifunctional uridylyltransferase/uridylyl-removing protein, partial [Acidovorax sp. 32-64-7]
MTEIHALRNAYRHDKATLLATMQATGASTRGIRLMLRKLSTLAGGLLQALWQRAQLPADLALVAVGGFGRDQLFPYSDVDVLLLLPEGCTTDSGCELRAQLESFIGSCWDAGLEIGSSVRTVAECLAESAQDVTVQTSLLEARLICGNGALFAQFQQQYSAQLNPQAFLVAKTLEMR